MIIISEGLQLRGLKILFTLVFNPFLNDKFLPKSKSLQTTISNLMKVAEC